MDTIAYSNLSRAQLSFDYLHTNSTTHEFLFGALAELLDNARDASATKMNIFTISDNSLRGGFILCFLDDGEGMDPAETAGIVTFGKSTKRSDDMFQIGMYGNGLKSGSMRIGNDLMLFTKKNGIRSCLFLSRTFHEEENIDEVIVPIPSFEKDSRKPHLKDARDKEKHALEMEIIQKYSPFRTLDHFFEQFDRIDGNNGTLVMVYNLKLLDSGEPELDILTDRADILLANPNSQDFDTDEGIGEILMPERKSFRAYTSVLYVDPRMRIYIQNTKVRTKKLACSLYKSKAYKYSSNRFKTRAENEAKRAIDEALAAENKAREAESKAKNLEVKSGSTTNKEHRANLRKAQIYAAECRGHAGVKRNLAERKAKSLKEPKTLNLIFGINIENRNHCGVFVYNCSRLIKMYEKVGPQNEGGVCCSGVVGIVDVPYLVLEPTHNKQDFADAKEYRHLLRAMGEHMAQYWKDVGIATQGITKFWENFGYISTEWKDPPAMDLKFTRKRAMQLSVTLQCDMCLKWRMIPFNSNNIGKEFPDHWVCAMNPDQQHSKCSSLEQKPNIPEGVLKKEVKSQEQKKRDLEEEILKKKEMLDKMMKLKVVESSKDVSTVMKKEEKSASSRKSRVRSPSPSPEPPSKSSRSSSKSASTKRGRRSPSPSPPPPPRSAASRSSSKSSASSKSTPTVKAPAAKSTPAPKPTPPAKVKSKRKSPSPPPKRAPPSRSKKRQVSEEEEEEEAEPLEDNIDDDVEEEEVEEEETPKASRRGRSQNNTPVEVKRKPTLKEKEIEFPDIPVKKQRISHFSKDNDKDSEKNKSKESVKDNSDKRSSRSDTVSNSRSSRSEAVVSSEKPTRSIRFNLDEEDQNSSEAEKKSSEAEKKSSEAEKKSKVDTEKKSKVDTEKKSKVDTDKNSSEAEEKTPSRASRSRLSKALPDAAEFTEENEVMSTETEESNKVKEEDVLGSKVDIKVNNKWVAGTISEVKEGKWKIKLDNMKDKQDKWYDNDDPNIKLLEKAAAAVVTNGVSSTSNQIADDIASGYRTCLRYFLPPQWIMEKHEISSMTLQELSDFPLDDFFDHYERGLRRLVSNFQSEASLQKKEADENKAKLVSVRKLISKLLKSTNEDFDIDPEEAGDQVDELLAACVRQATAPQP